jgi:hypothetical protein
MFIDDIKYRYTYLNSMKNVVHEEPIDRAIVPDRTIIIQPELEPVIDKLLRERPTWRFKSTEPFYRQTGVRTATNFQIYDGDEGLGRLWTERDWRNGSTRYNFSNSRLEKSRMRSGPSFTTKPAEAAKRIVKAFHLKTPSERASEAFSTVGIALQKVVNDDNWRMRKATFAIEEQLFAYAIKHWDEMKVHLATDTTLDFPALVQAERESQGMRAAFDGRDGVTVRVETNSSYLVSRRSDGGYVAETYNDSTLSDHLRGALGLLKLVDDGTAIPNVGIRVDANLYFVMDKKGESSDA